MPLGHPGAAMERPQKGFSSCGASEANITVRDHFGNKCREHATRKVLMRKRTHAKLEPDRFACNARNARWEIATSAIFFPIKRTDVSLPSVGKTQLVFSIRCARGTRSPRGITSKQITESLPHDRSDARTREPTHAPLSTRLVAYNARDPPTSRRPR